MRELPQGVLMTKEAHLKESRRLLVPGMEIYAYSVRLLLIAYGSKHILILLMTKGAI